MGLLLCVPPIWKNPRDLKNPRDFKNPVISKKKVP